MQNVSGSLGMTWKPGVMRMGWNQSKAVQPFFRQHEPVEQTVSRTIACICQCLSHLALPNQAYFHLWKEKLGTQKDLVKQHMGCRRASCLHIQDPKRIARRWEPFSPQRSFQYLMPFSKAKKWRGRNPICRWLRRTDTDAAAEEKEVARMQRDENKVLHSDSCRRHI